MDYLTVKNWDQYQHYKERDPPWIKLHRNLLNDYEFACLQDASKLHLMLIWLLASQSNGRIPNDASYIQSKISTSTKPNINLLIEKGFLIASNMLADCKQSAMPETEAETEYIRAKKTRASINRSPEVSEKVWNDFMAIRKAKRAPLTETALKGIKREADKAGMALEAALSMACERGWQGFKAIWVDSSDKPQSKKVAW